MAQVPPLTAAGVPSLLWKVISRLEKPTSWARMISRRASKPSYPSAGIRWVTKASPVAIKVMFFISFFLYGLI